MPPELYYKEPKKIDWAYSHHKNSNTGKQGQQLVLELERGYLNLIGRDDLACQVCFVDDWIGHDIRSFFADGKEKFIEVKTTINDLESSYFLSRNELTFLADNREQAFLYRVSIGKDDTPSRLKVYGFSEVIHANILPHVYKIHHRG